MNTSARYLWLVLAVIIGLHFLLSYQNEDYGRITSIDNLTSKIKSPVADKSIPDDYSPQTGFQNVTRPPITERRANATFVILARNSEIDGAVQSIRENEDKFNRKYKYPYVFLNEEPFTEEFKQRISVLTEATVEFGLIPHDHWFQPDWIDEEKAKASRDKMVEDGIIYGGSVSYRNMCRFNSGFFFKHELMLKYRWYWRIEPGVHFHCNMDFDPFLFMEDKGKVYGWTIALYEFEATIPTLWGHVKDFIKKHPQFVAPDNAMHFMSENGGESYNRCHFWSNFEIADLEFWRSPAYTAFFEYLDSQGGFYYERWGDAPVHSIAAALFARKDQLHWFEEIGYEHSPFTHCPTNDEKWMRGKCSCNQYYSFEYNPYTCQPKWYRLWQ